MNRIWQRGVRMAAVAMVLSASMVALAQDKLAETGLATAPALHVKAPLLADAVANFECELVDIVKPGDCPLIFGRVLAAHVNSDADLRRLYTVGAGHVMGGVRVLPATVVRPPASGV